MASTRAVAAALAATVSSTPKSAACTSARVMAVAPQSSVAEPYFAVASVVGHAVLFAPLVASGAPLTSTRTSLSVSALAEPWAERSRLTSTPFTTAFAGSAKPNADALSWLVVLPASRAAVAHLSSESAASPTLAHATLPVTFASNTASAERVRDCFLLQPHSPGLAPPPQVNGAWQPQVSWLPQPSSRSPHFGARVSQVVGKQLPSPPPSLPPMPPLPPDPERDLRQRPSTAHRRPSGHSPSPPLGSHRNWASSKLSSTTQLAAKAATAKNENTRARTGATGW